MPDQSSSDSSNLSAIFDTHVADEFDAKDLDATMATMVAEPSRHPRTDAGRRCRCR